jgi:gliding motility associated protien GldN
MKSILIVSALLLAGSTAMAQGTGSATVVDRNTTQTDEFVSVDWKPSLVRDGAYDRKEHRTSVLGWQHLREADVLWKRRVWREIDVREKQNMAFRYPGDDETGGGYFIEILMDAVKKGKIKAYSTFSDDRFTTAYTKDQVMELLAGKKDTTKVIDPITGQETFTITNRDFDPERVIKYRLKEDWLFDRNLGRMVSRIIGIAPIVTVVDPNTGEARGTSALMWIYYPEAREVLAQYEVFNPENDVNRMNWDDFFEGRFFSSKIIQTSNPFQERIQDRYANPTEALYQGKSEQERLFEKEHNMWVY